MQFNKPACEKKRILKILTAKKGKHIIRFDNEGVCGLKKIAGFRNFALVFLTMFAFWLLLSGKFDLFHISAGIVSSLAVALFSGKLILSNPSDRGGVAIEIYRFARYTLWLVYQIFVSGIDVTKRVFKVKMPINTGIIKCRPRLQSDVALTILANSITLTPGTMTLDISDGEIFIHCLAIDDEQKLMKSETAFEAHIMHMLGYKNRGDSK